MSKQPLIIKSLKIELGKFLPNMKSLISIVIPVYKNTDIFCHNLEINKQFFLDSEIIIMNDYPLENITEVVHKIIPTAKIYNNQKNLGFASNVNAGVKKSHGQYVFLLNSDVILKDQSFEKALDLFEKDDKLFAVSFAQFESNGQLVGGNTARFENGLLHHFRKQRQKIEANFWAEGGSMIFKKDIFVKLGLFDELYSPFYWEDIDLSYRAWKTGYHVLFNPQVKVEHHHETTIGKFFKKQNVLKIVYRNQFIFHWKNITDKDKINSHIKSLPKMFFSALIKKDWALIKGLFMAIKLLPKILDKRKLLKSTFIKNDNQVLSLFNND